MEHIGEAIRYYRGQRRMTQEELARRAGLSPGTIILLEKGEIKQPRIGTVHNLSEALEVDPLELQRFIMGPPKMPDSLEAQPEPIETKDAGTFTAVYQQDGEWWIGYVEELPGANAQERTFEEARESLKDALSDILDANRELTRREFEGRNVVRESISV